MENVLVGIIFLARQIVQAFILKQEYMHLKIEFLQFEGIGSLREMSVSPDVKGCMNFKLKLILEKLYLLLENELEI